MPEAPSEATAETPPATAEVSPTTAEASAATTEVSSTTTEASSTTTEASSILTTITTPTPVSTPTVSSTRGTSPILPEVLLAPLFVFSFFHFFFIIIIVIITTTLNTKKQTNKNHYNLPQRMQTAYCKPSNCLRFLAQRTLTFSTGNSRHLTKHKIYTA
jgi:cobalamin biosynthesis Mg chelatase CobN